MATPQRTTSTPAEALGISIVYFGWAIARSIQATDAGHSTSGFSDEQLIELIETELIFGSAAILILWARGYAVATLLPKPSAAGVWSAVVLYIVAMFLTWAVAAPFGSARFVEEMMMNTEASPLTVIALGLVNGSYEEIFLLGFFIRGLRGYSLPIVFGASLVLRALIHSYQGPSGVFSVVVFGAMLTAYYVSTGRLFPAVLAHAIADVVPFL